MFDSGFVRDTLTPLLAILGAVLGLAGTWMGILNYVRRYRVKLKISAAPFRQYNGETLTAFGLDITIVNHSVFAISVKSFGVVLKKPRGRTGRVEAHKNIKYPFQIEARHDRQFRVWLNNEEEAMGYSDLKRSEVFEQAVACYVETATGHRFTGRGKEWKFFKRFGDTLMKTGTIPHDFGE